MADAAVAPEQGSANRGISNRSKTIWILLVLLGAGFWIWRRRAGLGESLRAMDRTDIALGLGSLGAAKLLLGENARAAAVRSGIAINRRPAVELYNLSQLGKYLPGSIWQFVGRAAAYRRYKATFAQIRNALLTETIWAVGSAALFGAVLAGPLLIDASLDNLSTGVRIGIGALLIAGLVVVAIAANTRRRSLNTLAGATRPSFAVVVVLLGIWTLLGLSFVAFARAGGVSVAVVDGVGLFAGAYAVGFAVIFVPAGLGVRDGILTFGLLSLTDASETDVLAVVLVARVSYVVVELVLVAVQEVLPSRWGSASAEDPDLVS